MHYFSRILHIMEPKERAPDETRRKLRTDERFAILEALLKIGKVFG
jgi:hypothetical protein